MEAEASPYSVVEATVAAYRAGRLCLDAAVQKLQEDQPQLTPAEAGTLLRIWSVGGKRLKVKDGRRVP
jgi:hypothetical protein